MNHCSPGTLFLQRSFAVAGLLLLTVTSVRAQDAAYPRPKWLGDPAQLGRNIQRTMTLLAESTPQRRNTVRILLYGQSITEQDWWKATADDLRRRFPNANLIIENRALGGYSSQLLVKTAESDLYAFQPDLVIFHVYGAHNDYEDTIRRIRERTTAEVMIQTDHVTRDEDLTEETDPSKLMPNGKIWNSFMNYLHLPTVARKYDCALVDQRNIWKRYLTDYHVHAAALLRDDVHQNAYGNYLMSEIVNAYLVKRSEPKINPMECNTVHTVPVGRNLRWRQGKLTLPFDGSRVDIIAEPGKPVKAAIHIDGKRPSEMPSLYTFTRALATPGGKWPVILKIGSEALRQPEEWTMDVRRDAADSKRYAFILTGSRTGMDGEGRSDQLFVSTSRRVVIRPEDWGVEYALALAGVGQVPDRFTVRWKTVATGIDSCAEPADADTSSEHSITIASGLANGHHTLDIVGGPESHIAAIRIYRPPYGREETKMTARKAILKRPVRIVPIGDSITQGGRAGRPEFSYRYPLFYEMAEAGYPVEYVGSLQSGLNAEFIWPDRDGLPFDRRHEGHYGWKTADVLHHLPEWMSAWNAVPDIALIHLGTNDQGAPNFEEAITRPLEQIVALLRAKNRHVVVCIGHLNFNGGAALTIRPLVDAMARRLSTKDSPVVTVAHYEGWHEKPDEPGSDTFDWAHPNEQGQKKMAERWFGAMKPYLNRIH